MATPDFETEGPSSFFSVSTMSTLRRTSWYGLTSTIWIGGGIGFRRRAWISPIRAFGSVVRPTIRGDGKSIS